MHNIAGTDIYVVTKRYGLLLKEWACLAWILWYTCKTSAWKVLYAARYVWKESDVGWKHISRIIGRNVGLFNVSSFLHDNSLAYFYDFINLNLEIFLAVPCPKLF